MLRKMAHFVLNVEKYSGPPFIRPPFGNGKFVLIGGVASHEGYLKYTYTGFVL